MLNKLRYISLIIILFFNLNSFSQKSFELIQNAVKNLPQSAKPWVFWYWMNGCVSKEGITADLEAMQQVGIGGAYLMPIKDTSYKIDFQPQIRQLTPEWFAMVSFAIQEAKRLKIEIGLHFSDGFALAGGPWITPELSMQKLVWSKFIYNKSNWNKAIILEQPETNEQYYKDIKVFAYKLNYMPSNANLLSVTNNNGVNLSYLTNKDSAKTFRSDTTCFIDFKYEKLFTLRQIQIKKQNNAYQSQRFIVQASNDGITYFSIDTLKPPRHGWQDNSFGYTHSIKNYTSQYFRLLWKKEGTEPGSEELDAAKWKPVLRVQGIYLSEEPIINNVEAENGSVWRIANETTNQQVHLENIVSPKNILDLTKYLKPNGELNWQPNVKDNYMIVRIGHTSTGAKNETAGGGKGLECDKLNAKAVTVQYNNWFKSIYEKTKANGVVKTLHIDSWECGSQNWTNEFFKHFKQINKYDLDKYLLTATGVPIESIQQSKKVLLDYRRTIATLMNEQFFGTVKEIAKKNNLQISAESTAPTFVGDGLLHYKNVDIPMGEFWLNSPTHDKPNDMLDAISAAHIYGKKIVAAEAFTTLRMDWSEHPGDLKAIGDRAFASGINKMVLHVMVHNPWLNKIPGMTLDGIGLYYQRDQTWFAQSKAWIDYLTRTSAILQLGNPVADIGVFTGEDIPSRSLLPYKLVSTLPGIFGKEKVAEEKKRIENIDQPLRTIPDGVVHNANLPDPELYIDALKGYQYDCFNTDVLLQMQVKNGKITTASGMEYKVLVIPNTVTQLSTVVKNKIIQLTNAGAFILMDKKRFNIKISKIIQTPYLQNSFGKIGVKKDVEIIGSDKIAWTHRKLKEVDIYYFSNQEKYLTNVELIFSFTNRDFILINPVTGSSGYFHKNFRDTNGKSHIGIDFNANESFFIIFKPIDNEETATMGSGNLQEFEFINWQLFFTNEKITKTIHNSNLQSWTTMEENLLKYYSGSVVYTTAFNSDSLGLRKTAIVKLEEISNIATIKVNGIDCGTLWTAPYSLDISKAIQPGNNIIEIEVTNTWHNALIGDSLLPNEKRKTFTNAPFRLKDKPLLPAGIVGKVKLIY